MTPGNREPLSPGRTTRPTLMFNLHSEEGKSQTAVDSDKMDGRYSTYMNREIQKETKISNRAHPHTPTHFSLCRFILLLVLNHSARSSIAAMCPCRNRSIQVHMQCRNMLSCPTDTHIHCVIPYALKSSQDEISVNCRFSQFLWFLFLRIPIK